MSQISIKSEFLEDIVLGELRAKYSASGDRILRYYVDFRHRVLDIHKELSAPELPILQNKVDALIASWDAKTHAHIARQEVASSKKLAETMTVDASNAIQALAHTLAHTLDIDDTVDWNSLKDRSTPPNRPFTEPSPTLNQPPQPERRVPEISFFDVLFGRKRRLLQEAEDEFHRLLTDWRLTCSQNELYHAKALEDWRSRKSAHNRQQEAAKAQFLEHQRRSNARVDALRQAYEDGNSEAIIEHASMVLEGSDYGSLFEKSFEIEYDSENRILLLEYDLPSPDAMPTLKAVRFVQSTGEMKETHVSARDQKSNFESVCYQICLRTLHELFEADEHNHLEKILFNGFVTAIDRSTGQETRSCLMSVLVDRDPFLKIDLSRVEPKPCFKSLKGVSGASLAALSPIAPVMELNREDRRFVEGRTTADGLDEATNLAEMDWEDFEHLVRELFEKEFAVRGGEVRVTRSSGDGGVDAVAFDPDPISGGKIVIQAKRYTKTVGVAAVRDLYGTTVNEGAIKGILVTTADYGPDAYRFASDKPITLMTGANLLHLLERHGFKAKIDLKAAREARLSP